MKRHDAAYVLPAVEADSRIGSAIVDDSATGHYLFPNAVGVLDRPK